jgi:H+/Cl- antiporter ClcA
MRSPVTGIVLVMEMTASFPMLLPMLVPVTHHYLRRRLKTEPS